MIEFDLRPEVEQLRQENVELKNIIARNKIWYAVEASWNPVEGCDLRSWHVPLKSFSTHEEAFEFASKQI